MFIFFNYPERHA
ncbi:hypothetical protein ECTW09098_1488, partial [Escherichia coli TW09098]